MSSPWNINTASAGYFGMAYDSTGSYVFCPDACSAAYAYNGSGYLSTETLTEPVSGNVFVRTYTYTGSNLTAISAWVKQ